MAYIAASINKVPLPHIGSKRSDSQSQLLRITMPAAKTSLIGAIFVWER